MLNLTSKPDGADCRSCGVAMKMALLSAQKMAREIESDSQTKADEVIAAAQAQADEIIAAAQAEADAITGDIKAKADAEELRYQKAKATATEYLQSMRLLAERQLGLLAGIEEADLTDAAIVTPAPAEKKALPQRQITAQCAGQLRI